MTSYKLAVYTNSGDLSGSAICDAVTGAAIKITNRNEAAQFAVGVFSGASHTLPTYQATYGVGNTIDYPAAYAAYDISIKDAAGVLYYSKTLTIADINKTASYAALIAGTAQTLSFSVPAQTLPTGNLQVQVLARVWSYNSSTSAWSPGTGTTVKLGYITNSVAQSGDGAFKPRVRLALNVRQPDIEDAVNLLTEAEPVIFNGNSCRFEFAIFDGAALANLANFNKFDFCVKKPAADGSHASASDNLANALKETSAIDDSITLAAWQAGGAEACHFAFDLSPVEATVGSGIKWLIVRGYTAEGGIVTFYAGRIYVRDDGRGPDLSPTIVEIARGGTEPLKKIRMTVVDADTDADTADEVFLIVQKDAVTGAISFSWRPTND